MAKQNMKLKDGPCSTPDENEFVFGYPTNICDDVPGHKYLCCNCNNVLKKALQTLCGHRYCSLCLSWIVRNNKRPICPKCKEDEPASLNEDCFLTEERAFSDAAINKEISELKVHCVTSGCSWSGVLKDYEDHESFCDYALIPCHTGCGRMVLRRQLADHLERECSNNMTTCQKCTQSISSNEYPKHKCDRNSLEDQSRRKSEHLVKGKNHAAVVATWKDRCRFSQIGCSYRGSQEKTKEHEKSSTGAHLGLVLQCIQQIKNGSSSAKVTENGLHETLTSTKEKTFHTSFSALQIREANGENGEVDLDCHRAAFHPLKESTPHECDTRVSELEARVQVFENIIAVLNREIDHSNVQLTAIQDQRIGEQRRMKTLEKKIADLQCSLAMKDMALNGQHARLLSFEQTSYDGIFLWKIAEITQKCHEAITGRSVTLYSPAFYTARYGYKVCLRVYLNGDGAGKGTHVSLFFTVMKGEYDALLPWPFKHKVTFMLLDQSNREHVLDAFRPDLVSASFQRPISDMNVASGCPLFCPLSKLQSSKHTYVKDDAIFIKCIIDINP
ncbi:hypothetical protein FKM82_005437 [Ascaphus truei]